jgi:hypothetical protein
MLGVMRQGTLLIVIRPEYHERLARRATRDRRSPREQAAFLLEQALEQPEEAEHQPSPQPEAVA